jgi:hypothetical protein
VDGRNYSEENLLAKWPSIMKAKAAIDVQGSGFVDNRRRLLYVIWLRRAVENFGGRRFGDRVGRLPRAELELLTFTTKKMSDSVSP